MDAKKDREIIRLWNRLRALEKQGEPTLAALREIRAALAERDHATSVAVQKSASLPQRVRHADFWTKATLDQ